jgi:hypothetical protein
MALKIVWQNPLRPRGVELKVHRLGTDQFGSVYAATNIDARQEFDLLLCQMLCLPDKAQQNARQLLSKHKDLTTNNCFSQASGIFCRCFGLIRRRF